MFIRTYEHPPAQHRPTAAPIHEYTHRIHKQYRKIIHTTNLRLKQSKTTVNGEKLGQTLAPVMVKPPPTTNTFPVEKTTNQSKIQTEHRMTKKRLFLYLLCRR
jgi:hypothetical protein